MTSVSLDRLAHVLGVNDEREHDSHSFATVTAVNQDGSYQVAFNGSASSTRAAKCCNADAGDRVLCLISHGQVSAVGRVGGDGGKPPVVLYDNASGNNGNVTLTETVANYDYARVYFWVNEQYSSSDVYKPNGKTVSLFAVRSANQYNNFHFGGATYRFDGTNLNCLTQGIADVSGAWAGSSATFIYRVEAWCDGASVGFGSSSGGGGGEGHSYRLDGEGATVKLFEDGTANAGTYTIPDSTSSTSGLMTASQHSKLDGIADNANDYTHPSYAAHASGFYKIASDATGHVSGVAAVAKSDITSLGIPAQDTTYSDATQSSAGLMSATDKAKLDGVAAGATDNEGTVTSVAAGTGLTGGTITTSGTLAHSTANGYKHIPSNGSANQYLRYSSAGTAAWQTPDSSPTSGSSRLATSGGIYTALDGKADASHVHSAADITGGVLAEARGGTGASSFKGAIDGWAYDTASSSVGDYGAMWLDGDDTVHVGGSLPTDYGGVPSGGSTGQVLTRTSSGYAWQTPSGGGGESTPTGTVSMFAGSTAPSGWLLCQGQAVSRTTYSALFAVIGTTYGSGNGSTTFNIPNLQGRFPLGSSGSHALGTTGGAESVTLTANDIPAHTHNSKTITGQVGQVLVPSDQSYTSSSLYFVTKDNVAYPSSESGTARRRVIALNATHEHDSVGGGGAHDNMPPFQTVNYIIKA